MNKFSLKLKLAIIFSLIIITICGALGVTFFRQMRNVLLEGFIKQGLLLAQNLAYNSRFGVA